MKSHTTVFLLSDNAWKCLQTNQFFCRRPYYLFFLVFSIFYTRSKGTLNHFPWSHYIRWVLTSFNRAHSLTLLIMLYLLTKREKELIVTLTWSREVFNWIRVYILSSAHVQQLRCRRMRARTYTHTHVSPVNICVRVKEARAATTTTKRISESF